MIVDIGIVAAKAFLVLFMVLNLAGILGWIERKGSALIQDRIGANRASVFGFAGMGLVNTLIADPLKFLTKEDFVPPQGDKFLHTLAPCMALFTALVTFAVIPFGDVLVLGDRTINLQVADLNIGILYVFAMGSLGVYGIVIGAWASKQSRPLEGRFALEKAVAEYTAKFGIGSIPRPDYWSGFRLKPLSIEFWHDRPFRLHDRVEFKRIEGGWEKVRKYP